MNWIDLVMGSVILLPFGIPLWISLSGILEGRRIQKERRRKYLCLWCNQSLSDNRKYDVFIMHRGSDWIFCSWKCAYQFIKNEIIHTI
jgi:hypothetical protein